MYWARTSPPEQEGCSLEVARKQNCDKVDHASDEPPANEGTRPNGDRGEMREGGQQQTLQKNSLQAERATPCQPGQRQKRKNSPDAMLLRELNQEPEVPCKIMSLSCRADSKYLSCYDFKSKF